MSSTFTAYIRSLGPDGGPPNAESFGALLDTLRGALIHEMRRRSVWDAPPSFLGIYGASRWSEGDVIEELLLGCYHYIFLQRLAGLRRQLRVRSNLDGLIFLNIRHFLHEAQRRHDPLGMRLFEIAHRTVESLHRAGTLHVLDGDPRIRNFTVLGFAVWRDPQEALAIDLRAQVTAWCDALLPDLVTAWGKQEIVEQLAERIARLPDDGVDVFRFRDLLDPLKSEVRARWRALHADGETVVAETREEQLELVWRVDPDSGFEERQSFSQLLRCVGKGIDDVQERAKTKEYLRRLWLGLRHWAAEPEADAGDAEDGELAADAVEALDTADRFPSGKRLGELLSIPRARIPGLKETLGRLLESCRSSFAGPPKEPRPRVAAGERREELRLATGRAIAAAVTEEAAFGERAETPPRRGEIFLLGATQAVPVEWLVVEEDAGRGRFWVAPIDQAPFVGSGDVEVVRGGDAAIVRCGAGTWVAAAVFDAGLWTGGLAAAEVERVRKRHEAMTRDGFEASSEAREVDDDSEYRDWAAELQAACAEFNIGGAEVIPFEPRRGRGAPFLWRALAAVFAMVAMGLGLWSASLRRDLGRGSEPILVLRSATQVVRFEPQRVLEVRVSQDARHLGFRVPLSRYASYDAVRLRLIDIASDEIFWASDWVSGESELFLVLPRVGLSARFYMLRLEGRRPDGTEVEIDESKVEIEPLD